MNEMVAAVARLSGSVDQARPSNRRLGEELARDGRVDLEPADGRVEAIVSSPHASRRRVTFHHGSDMRWSCTCMKDPSPWCKHVVAAVIMADRKSS